MNDYTAGKAWKLEKKQHILSTAFRLFAGNGIEQVRMPEVAEESGVSRATLYRYFSTKLDLVVAVGAWKWDEFIQTYRETLSDEAFERMTGAEQLRFYMDSFLNLYRKHGDMLRFNYNFNGYLRHEAVGDEQKQPYMRIVDRLGESFYRLWKRGMEDGTLRNGFPWEAMFSASFHIMLAAATRYAVGLVYVPEKGIDPESELIMLEELLLSRYVAGA